jgi:hypothetical protein
MHMVHSRELNVTADRGPSVGISGPATDGLLVRESTSTDLD